MREREELAWVGGLFEGEGTVGAYPRGNKAISPQPRISIYSSDHDVLERAQEYLGMGHIHLRPAGRWATKPHYLLTICSWEKVQAVIAMLWPFLGERRRQQAKDTLLARGPG